jgi:hypothetical protein
MVKDGFLLYYADGEKKEIEKRKYFNIHPKVSFIISQGFKNLHC